METIKELFDVIKGRIASPLFGSFILFWIIVNWQIPVTLLFYKQIEVRLDGYISFTDMIIKNLSLWYNLIIPLIMSLIYTFGYPWIKAKIDEWNIKIYTESEQRIIKLSDGKSMPMSKYILEVQKLRKREDELELIAFEKSELNDRLNQLSQTLHDKDQSIIISENQIKSINRQLDSFKQFNSIYFFNGSWYIYLNDAFLDIWIFKDGTIYNEKMEHILTLSHMNGNPETSSLFLFLNTMNADTKIISLYQTSKERYDGQDGEGKKYRFVKNFDKPTALIQ